MTKPEIPPLKVTGGSGRYVVHCPACDASTELHTNKADAHAFAERHRRRPHPKTIAGTIIDPIGVTDNVVVELTTPPPPTPPEEDTAA